MINDLHNLYQDIILDHASHPHHFGMLDNATHSAHGINPICSDEVTVYLIIENGIIKKIQFTGAGCALSIASASLMTDAIINKSISEIQSFFNQFHSMLMDNNTHLNELGKLSVFTTVNQYPMRVKCVTLAWHALLSALKSKHGPVSMET